LGIVDNFENGNFEKKVGKSGELSFPLSAYSYCSYKANGVGGGVGWGVGLMMLGKGMRLG